MEKNIRAIHPGQRPSSNRADFQMIEKIARLMDSKFAIPGTKIRFGFDPILSLFPVFGDLATFVISGALIYMMHTRGASGKVVVKMAMNATLDAIISAIPVVGTVFDIFYRANDRNVRLLKEHYLEGKHLGSGHGLLLVVGLAAVLIVSAVFYGLWKLFEAIF